MNTLTQKNIYKILLLIIGVLSIYGLALAQTTAPYFLSATINTYALDTGAPISASYTGQVAVDLESPVFFNNTDDPSNRLDAWTGRVDTSDPAPSISINTVTSANNYYEFGNGSYIEVVRAERCNQIDSPTATSVPESFAFNGLAVGQTCEVEINVYLSPKELGSIKVISSDSGMPYSICLSPHLSRDVQCVNDLITSEEVTTINFPLSAGVDYTAQLTLESPMVSYLYAVNNSQDGRTLNNWPGSNGNITSVASTFSTDDPFNELTFFVDRQRKEMFSNLEAYVEGTEPESITDGSQQRQQNNTVSVPSNQNAVLMWNSLHADTCKITAVPVGEGQSRPETIQSYTTSRGEVLVNPSVDTLYELTCQQLSDSLTTRNNNS